MSKTDATDFFMLHDSITVLATSTRSSAVFLANAVRNARARCANREFIFGGNPTWRGAASDQFKKKKKKESTCLRGFFKAVEKIFPGHCIAVAFSEFCQSSDSRSDSPDAERRESSPRWSTSLSRD